MFFEEKVARFFALSEAISEKHIFASNEFFFFAKAKTRLIERRRAHLWKEMLKKGPVRSRAHEAWSSTKNEEKKWNSKKKSNEIPKMGGKLEFVDISLTGLASVYGSLLFYSEYSADERIFGEKKNGP